MKYGRFLIFALAFIVSPTIAQELPIDPVTNKVKYGEVVVASGMSKEDLFDRSKKWFAIKNSDVSPYTITLDNIDDGTVIGKGGFLLPGERRKYIVYFTLKIDVKQDKFRYEFSDIMVQYKTAAGSSGGGFAYYSGSSYKEAETIEYTLETFYPSRMKGRKPEIRWYEDINKNSFRLIDKEMLAISASLKETLTKKADW